jgi:hypothetical protein
MHPAKTADPSTPFAAENAANYAQDDTRSAIICSATLFGNICSATMIEC